MTFFPLSSLVLFQKPEGKKGMSSCSFLFNWHFKINVYNRRNIGLSLKKGLGHILCLCYFQLTRNFVSSFANNSSIEDSCSYGKLS